VKQRVYPDSIFLQVAGAVIASRSVSRSDPCGIVEFWVSLPFVCNGC